MWLFNFFKKRNKKQISPEKLFLEMYPDRNGAAILYETYKNVSKVMEKKLSKQDAFAFFIKCSMKLEMLDKNDKTFNKIIEIIQTEKPNLYNDNDLVEIALQIMADETARMLKNFERNL